MSFAKSATQEIAEPELGWIETRKGFADGQRHKWPLKERVITITKNLVRLNECIAGTYCDHGEVKFENNERIRIFDLLRESVFTISADDDE